VSISSNFLLFLHNDGDRAVCIDWLDCGDFIVLQVMLDLCHLQLLDSSGVCCGEWWSNL